MSLHLTPTHLNRGRSIISIQGIAYPLGNQNRNRFRSLTLPFEESSSSHTRTKPPWYTRK